MKDDANWERASAYVGTVAGLREKLELPPLTEPKTYLKVVSSSREAEVRELYERLEQEYLAI